MAIPLERPTQETIAREAGCSVMTVSRALRGYPHISPDLRERILGIAERMAYRPDPVLSVLNAYRTRKRKAKEVNVLAFLTNWRSELGWRQFHHLIMLYDGIGRRAAELGFKVEHMWLGDPALKKRRASEILYARGIQGLILAPLQANVGHITMDWAHFTTVSIGYSVVSPRTHSVTTDYYQGMVAAWRRLNRLGYQRIGLAFSRRHEVRTRSRWSAAFESLQAHLPKNRRVPSLLDAVEEGSAYSPATLGQKTFERWFRKHQPDAVLSLGPGTPDWIRKTGRRVPEDVGYGNLDLQDPDGEMSGIYQHPELIGTAAVDLLQILLQRFESGLPEVPQNMVIDPTWIDGKTTSARRR